jgi:hypothetical protein
VIEKGQAMRIEKQATSLSWIPSESIPGLLRLPFKRGVMHYDPPPPLTLTDLDARRERGELRFANRLRAYVEVDNGRVTSCGYLGGIMPGLTPVTVGPLRVLLPAKPNPDIQWAPVVTDDSVTFTQTAGCRPGFSFVRPSLRWPFIVTRPFLIWTTVQLTIGFDGSCAQAIVGASPFPRHWLYDDGGDMVQKTALTRNQVWMRTVFGSHSPCGGEDRRAAVAEPETALERTLADTIMQGAEKPVVRRIDTGGSLFRQGEEASTLVLVLDGDLEISVDGVVVGHVGPGAVVGERGPLEGGRRTADVRAVTEARVADVPADAIETGLLAELAQHHHRERGS